MPERNNAYLALLTTALIWGIAVAVIKYTLKFIDPFSFLFWRFLIVSAILLPVFLVFVKKHPLKIVDLPKLLWLGTLSTTACLAILFVGLKYTTAIDASLISILSPIMIVLGGALFLKEKVTKQEKIGLTISFVGAIIALLQPLLERQNAPPRAIFGNLLVFGHYIGWAAYTLLWKKDSKKYHPLTITFFNFFAGLVTIFPIFLYQRWTMIDWQKSVLLPVTPIFYINPKAWFGILYMSIFSSIIAYFTYNYGVSKIEASEATLFTYLQPLFAAPLAILWLGEKITLPFVVGAIFIVFGITLTEARKRLISF